MREKRARGWVRSTPARIIELRGRMAWSTIVRRRTSWNPLHSWIALAGAGRRRPYLGTTVADRLVTKGLDIHPDPPTVEEIIAVMRAAGDGPDGVRLRGVIVVLWRAGLRVSEALALAESDLDRVRGAIQVRLGKGGRRREVGMDRWAWEALDPWLTLRAGLPIGALFCVLRGPTRGRPCSAAGVRVQLRNAAIAAGVRRRLAPHQLRHAHAVEMSRRVCRWSSSSGSSGMPTSGSRPCTCVASITLRSCTRSTSARPR